MFSRHASRYNMSVSLYFIRTVEKISVSGCVGDTHDMQA